MKKEIIYGASQNDTISLCGFVLASPIFVTVPEKAPNCFCMVSKAMRISSADNL